MTRSRLSMRFETAAGSRLVSVQNPIADLSAAQVQSAAMNFIGANPFASSVGPLLSLQRAEIITVEEIVLL